MLSSGLRFPHPILYRCMHKSLIFLTHNTISDSMGSKSKQLSVFLATWLCVCFNLIANAQDLITFQSLHSMQGTYYVTSLDNHLYCLTLNLQQSLFLCINLLSFCHLHPFLKKICIWSLWIETSWLIWKSKYWNHLHHDKDVCFWMVHPISWSSHVL